MDDLNIVSDGTHWPERLIAGREAQLPRRREGKDRLGVRSIHEALSMYPSPRRVLIDGPSGSSFLRSLAICTSSALGATASS
jgi:hypothetical protein